MMRSITDSAGHDSFMHLKKKITKKNMWLLGKIIQ